ncbi:hypothetical protein TrRE_jg7725 [Triparma retinervis]|uniref:Uncharacterized protein n=1 Tax=Triparma retinervis TaxID=2557542 RepID=A0A9W7DVA3_9STRA|nr:hypothetical protein TrRE_jg7725 [Triparma retinervis]
MGGDSGDIEKPLLRRLRAGLLQVKSTKRILGFLASLLFLITILSADFCSFYIEGDSDNPVIVPRVDYNPLLLIAVVCNGRSIQTLGPTVLDTWAKGSPFDFRFFVGRETGAIPPELEPYTVRLDAPDGYPPRPKVFEMWKVLHDDFPGYDWYMKADIDAYINTETLQSLVAHLNTPTDFGGKRETVGYLGKGGAGREFERAKLGLKGKYCMGMGYIMGWTTLHSLREELDWCFANLHSQHSDTEIGNCNYRASGITCSDAHLKGDPSDLFINFYYNYEKSGRVTSAKISAENDGQVHSQQDVFFGPPLKAVLVHPLKTAEGMRKLHDQVSRNLRPMLRPPWIELPDQEDKKSYLRVNRETSRITGVDKQLLDFFDGACTHDPVTQKANTNIELKECSSPEFSSPPTISSLTTYVMNLPHREDRFELTKQRFAHTSLTINRFERVDGNEVFSGYDMPDLVPVEVGKTTEVRKMTPGEMGLRQTVRNLIARAMATDIQLLLLLDDDVVPHDDFDRLLLNVLIDKRCGSHLFTEEKGGALQLGATVWNEAAWELLDADMLAAKRASGRRGNAMCFNSHHKVSGSFAVIFHRNTFQELLDWLDHGPIQPFDWVFGWLGKKGYVTRVAYPFVVIPDLTVESDADNNRGDLQHDMEARVKVHRWNIREFSALSGNAQH